MDYSQEMRDLYLMEQIYSTFFSTTNKLQMTGDRYLVEITARQYMMLPAIAHLPESEATLVNIARKLETSKQSAKKLLGNLNSKGCVVTVPHKLDKRSINAVMTDIFKDFTSSELETLWNLIQNQMQALEKYALRRKGLSESLETSGNGSEERNNEK